MVLQCGMLLGKRRRIYPKIVLGTFARLPSWKFQLRL